MVPSKIPASESRPWWPASPQDAATLAVKCKHSGEDMRLFELVAVAAAGHDWALFAAAMAALCDISRRSVRNMLDSTIFDSGWGLLYGATGMPPALLPVFVEILNVARKFPHEAGKPRSEGAKRSQRLAVLQQALASPALRGFDLPSALRAALLT